MGAQSVALAARAKGMRALFNRAGRIRQRYGVTPEKFGDALHLYAQTLRRFDCGASFPVTAVALERNSRLLAQYLPQDIELAVHGYTHIDYTRLVPDELRVHLLRARETFTEAGVVAVGFRSPYLRNDAAWHKALEETGFSYTSSQPILWDVLDPEDLEAAGGAGYRRAISFYAPWDARQRPSLPQLYGGIVEIPVSLPDDEMLLDRLGGWNGTVAEKAWKRILTQAYQRGELFTLQLHPERIGWCVAQLAAALAAARSFTPAVWIARLDQIAAWWKARAQSMTQVIPAGDDGFRIQVAGPSGTTVLVRAVHVDEPTVPWADGYQRVPVTLFTARASSRPFIGISTQASPRLASFLRQQGYIIEITDRSEGHALFFDQREFTASQELPLLAKIEGSEQPLVRLGRWPDGARCALAVTGDIDAVTVWDFGLRLLGK